MTARTTPALRPARRLTRWLAVPCLAAPAGLVWGASAGATTEPDDTAPTGTALDASATVPEGSDPAVDLPLDEAIAAFEAVIAAHPVDADDEVAPLDECPLISVDEINGVFAESGQDWKIYGRFESLVGFEELEPEDGVAPGSSPIATSPEGEPGYYGISCQAALSEVTQFSLVVVRVPIGFQDFGVDDDSEITIVEPSEATLGGTVYESCEVDEDDEDEGTECGHVWVTGDLAIGVSVDNNTNPVEPAAVTDVLLSVLPTVVANLAAATP